MSRERLAPGLIALLVLVMLGAGVVAVVLATRGDEGGAGGPAVDRGPSPTARLTGAQLAEQDAPDLPGIFVTSQGRQHLNSAFSLEREPRAFCLGVAWSGAPQGEPAVTLPTPAAPNCYASNPPSSGAHLNVQRNVDVTGNGDLINIPADPGVYPPEIDFGGPLREAIPHILEHAGVFVGYNCAPGDTACDDVVRQLARVVNDRIDNHDDRVVMGRDSDLVPGTIGLASWTRVDGFLYQEFDEQRVVEFIDAHSCRFDPEGFCR